MDKAFGQSIVLPVFAGLALSLVLELQIRPRVQAFWRRESGALCAHVAVWLLLFCAELAMFRRPWLASINVSALLYVFVLVSNAKQQALREPFIYQDFDYCVDMLKHPRLYLPFLGLGRAVVGIGAIVGALYLGLHAEASMLEQVSSRDFILGLGVLLLLTFALMWIGATTRLRLTFEPDVDLQRLGFLSCLWAYAVAEKRSLSRPAIQPTYNHRTRAASSLPHLVVVQSESFFDVRRWLPTARADLFSAYDNVIKAARHHGRVTVPAWGANTVRTEFAFLSGLAPSSLGIHRFNPYRSLIRRTFPTLASHLRSLGYETICVHPYPASFYRRDRVFPLLGFDRFVDIGAFEVGGQAGPYVDDVTLANKVCEIMQAASAKPCFVFVITMENHGPLHLEARQAGEAAAFFTEAPPEGCDDLSVYLRHIVNANRMVDILRGHLESMAHPSWFCWYGDHVPIMEKVYRAVGLPDGRTDYFIWQKGGAPAGDAPHDLNIEALAPLLLRRMKLGD